MRSINQTSIPLNVIKNITTFTSQTFILLVTAIGSLFLLILSRTLKMLRSDFKAQFIIIDNQDKQGEC
jgi:hypothetical protein